MSMIDNLTEAIAHAREVAKENRNGARLFANNPFYGTTSTKYEECASEHEQLAEWLTELQERREADRWIPVSERLPEDFLCVLVYCPPFDNTYCVFRECGDWHMFGCDDVLMEAVTHWRPLPKPESEAEK